MKLLARCMGRGLVLVLLLGSTVERAQETKGDQDSTHVETQQQKSPSKFGGPSSAAGKESA